jgi:hypothetical protein
MKKETRDQLKVILQQHESNKELESALQYLRMITSTSKEPSPYKGIAWIKWYRSLNDVSLNDARTEMLLRRDEVME